MEERRLCKIKVVAWAIHTILLLILADGATASPHKKVIFDYVGASVSAIDFNSVPVDANLDFILLLTFAIDATADGQPNNGIFNSFWPASITPQSIAAFKAKHHNVKVMASWAGNTIFVSNNVVQRNVVWNDPQNPRQWIDNAVRSLTTMANNWHLDGYDVSYEIFNGNSKYFSYCVGEVITQLKHNHVITMATIAPFSNTALLYRDLYHKYSGVIDFVNYQFYFDNLSSINQYKTYFGETVAKFNAHGKTTASVHLAGKGLDLHDFVIVATSLLKTHDLPGVMLWDLDASAGQNYAAERSLQAVLNGT